MCPRYTGVSGSFFIRLTDPSPLLSPPLLSIMSESAPILPPPPAVVGEQKKQLALGEELELLADRAQDKRNANIVKDAVVVATERMRKHALMGGREQTIAVMGDLADVSVWRVALKELQGSSPSTLAMACLPKNHGILAVLDDAITSVKFTWGRAAHARLEALTAADKERGLKWQIVS